MPGALQSWCKLKSSGGGGATAGLSLRPDVRGLVYRKSAQHLINRSDFEYLIDVDLGKLQIVQRSSQHNVIYLCIGIIGAVLLPGINGAPAHLLLQGLPGQGGHGLWLALYQDQPKGSVSLTLGFSERKFGLLVVALSLEFSRLPAMLSPLKTTLFPVLP